MAEASIGGAALLLKADTTQLSKGLSQADKSVSGFIGTIGGKFSGVAKEGASAIGDAVEGNVDGVVDTVTGMLGAIPGPIGVIGGLVGGLVGSVAKGIINWFLGVDSEVEKAKDRADKAFGSILDGSKTIEQAMNSVKLDALNEEMKEVQKNLRKSEESAEKLRGTFIGAFISEEQIQQALNARLEEDVNKALQRAEMAQRRLEMMLANPRYQQLMRTQATARAESQTSDLVTQLRDEAARVGMTADESRRLEIAQRLAAESGMSLAEAQRQLAWRLDEVRVAQQQLARLKSWDDLKKKAEEVAKSFSARVASFGQSEGQQRLAELRAELEALDKQTEKERSIGAGEDARITRARQAIQEAMRQVSVDDIRLRQLEQMKKLTDQLADQERQIATFGMTAREQQIYGLEQEIAAINELIEANENLSELEYFMMQLQQEEMQDAVERMQQNDRILTQLERRQELEEQGAQLFEQMRTPTEQVADELERLDEMLAEGVISWETYRRAISRAVAQLGDDRLKTTDVALEGSRQAVTDVINARVQTMGVQRQEDRVQRIMEDQRGIQRDSLRELQDIRRELRDFGILELV